MTSTQAARTPHLSRRVRAVRVATAVTLTIGLAVAGAPPGTAADRESTYHPAHTSRTRNVTGEHRQADLLASGHRELFGVDAASGDNVWAVGNGGGEQEARALHFDGVGWAGTDPPGGPVSALCDVAVISSDDAWGIGQEYPVSMAAHWDGDRWTRVPTPRPDAGDEEDVPYAIAAAAPDDIWAVGYTFVLETTHFRPLILHWDGTVWVKIPYTLPYGNTDGLLEGVTVIAPDDIWAVGDTWGVNGSDPLMLHWDGTSWTPNADLLTTDSAPFGLDDVDAAGPDDVWAVGADVGSVAIVHWNGHVWRQLPGLSRSHDPLIDRLWGVHAISPDDVWAVGGRGDLIYPPQRITILHWNGHRWSKQKAPNPGAKSNQLWDVAATGPNDVWAVGSYANDDYTTHHLVLHYDGHRWTRSR